MRIYSNIEKSKIINKNYRNLNTQKDKKFLEKLKEISELFIKLYLVALIFLLLLDYSLLINVFNIETAYFNIILLNNEFFLSNLIYILIPFLFMFMFFISGILSFKISILIKKIIPDIDNLKKFIIIIFISFFIIYVFLIFIINTINHNLGKSSFSMIFIIIIFLYIILKGIIGSFSLSLIKLEYQLFFNVFIVPFILFAFIFLGNYFSNVFENISFSIILYLFYHMFSEIYYKNYLKNRELFSEKKSNASIEIIFDYKILVVFISLVILFVTFESYNTKQWSKSIKINYQKKAFLDGSYNLIFNRGLLLNNKNLKKIKISKLYLKYLDISSIQYIRDKSCEISESEIEYNFSENSQYLQVGKNLRMYFETINLENNENRTFIFFVEEEQEKIKLIELSEYENT